MCTNKKLLCRVNKNLKYKAEKYGLEFNYIVTLVYNKILLDRYNYDGIVIDLFCEASDEVTTLKKADCRIKYKIDYITDKYNISIKMLVETLINYELNLFIERS